MVHALKPRVLRAFSCGLSTQPAIGFLHPVWTLWRGADQAGKTSAGDLGGGIDSASRLIWLERTEDHDKQARLDPRLAAYRVIAQADIFAGAARERRRPNRP